MKVFISWSGEISGKVARAFRDWLPYVIHSIQPYVSSEDIEKGRRWAEDISKELDTSSFGIICVTRDNMKSPWLNFEAGALSKSIKSNSINKLCPFLFGLAPDETGGPLQQFQCATYSKEDIRKLVFSLNASCGEGGIDKERLEGSFNVWWPKLDDELKKLYELVNKKILWIFEDSHTNAEKEINIIYEEGYTNFAKWFLDSQENAPIDKCDLAIYIYRKAEESMKELKRAINFLKTGGEAPILVYTYYASGNKYLDPEEVSVLQEYDGKYMFANMPNTIKARLKELVNSMV